jgi:RNA polymerase sigma-70 factor (ECF subfamily)
MIHAELRDETDADVACIARWRAGEQQAATELVARHTEALARFVARLGVRGESETVVQDTFVRAFGALDQFRGDSSFRTWLFTIARRLVIDEHRRSGRRGVTEDLDASHAVVEYNALDELVADETSRRVQEAMARLSPMQRQVFMSRVQDGLSYREIADRLGTTEGAARVHYHNAMRSVREFLHE